MNEKAFEDSRASMGLQLLSRELRLELSYSGFGS